MDTKTHHLSDIYEPILEDLDRVGRRLGDVVSEALQPFPREIGAFRSMGKRLRPALTLLTYRSEINETGRNAAKTPDPVIDQAAAIELMHIATLIHDDVVDGSYQRRGHQTLHRLFNDKTAVLVGDYLYATAIDIFNRHGSRHIVKTITRTTVGMAHGELMQVLLTPEERAVREIYQDIISKKTADFFGAAALVGAEAAGQGWPSAECDRDGASVHSAARTAETARSERHEIFRKFGWNFGMAFQMIDDILDFTASESNLGKPVFQDVVDGKVTLPAILLLETGNAATLRRILKERKLTPEDRGTLTEDLNRHDIVPRAIREAEGYLSEAKILIGELFGTARSSVPHALMSLCDYIVMQKGLSEVPVNG